MLQRSVLYSVLLALLSVQGCGTLGAVAEVFSPPKAVDARYQLPDKRTLVLVDDPAQLVDNPATLRRIAAATRAALETEQVVTAGFVQESELGELKNKLGPAYATTSLAGLALALDAKQVIHAEVQGYQINMAETIVRPVIVLDVKVFDLDERARVFPAGVDPETGVDLGQKTYPLTVRLSPQDLSGADAARAIAVRDLSDTAGRDIGRLFFDWRKPIPGSNPGRK